MRNFKQIYDDFIIILFWVGLIGYGFTSHSFFLTLAIVAIPLLSERSVKYHFAAKRKSSKSGGDKKPMSKAS